MSMTDGQGETLLGLFNRGRTTGPDTGGGDIGHWGGVGGIIPGLHGTSAIASTAAPALLLRKMKQRQAAKNYNDQRTSTTIGSDNGQKVEDVTGMGQPRDWTLPEKEIP